MRRNLPSGEAEFQWEGSFLVGGSFLMERELSSEKRASQWEGSFLVGRELISLKGAS